MRVDIIETAEALERLRSNWDAVYDVDPEAQFFLSWPWLTQWLGTLANPWFILAAKAQAEGSDYVAFLPLQLRTKFRKGAGFYNELNMAGNDIADYTGLICIPGYDRRAITAIGRRLQQLRWTRIHFENMRISDDRMRILLSSFSARLFDVAEFERINARDNINNRICLSVALPPDWNRYLTEKLSANKRQKLRRFLRIVDSSGEFRIAHADAETIERDLDILLEFWTAKWGARKGERVQAIVKSNRIMLANCFRIGVLFLPVLWKGSQPLGVLASMIDRRKKSLLFFMGARHQSFEHPPPGMVLHAHSIRYAIEQGLSTYDFLRGNESYKYSFGTKDHLIRCVTVTTRDRRNLGGRLNMRSIPRVFERAVAFHKAGEFEAAELAYRQILIAEPDHQTVLFCLGQLTSSTGDHQGAARLFKRLVGVNPELVKAWLLLGRSLRKCGRFGEAANAYRRVTLLEPMLPAGHLGLGTILFGLGKPHEAIVALQRARLLEPANEKIELWLANALRASGTCAIIPTVH